MITKFKTIKNLAVFKDFNWDSCLRDKGNNVIPFKQINILYGRNYSGKTTLSRIVRAMETGTISDKYEIPQFEVCITGSPDITLRNLTSHEKKIRVFNEDFVKDNLRFFINPEDSITPFAIVGGNVAIEDEVEELKRDLGNSTEGEETGFYQLLNNAIINSRREEIAYNTEMKALDQKLTAKATDKLTGIRYKSEFFGDQNYNKAKLSTDIEYVMVPSFTPLTDEEAYLKHQLLKEIPKQSISVIPKPELNISELNSKTRELMTRSISSSNKIEQLLKDAVLNRWVKDGRDLHKEKLDECSFCGNTISNDRWAELDSHFDEESNKLEKEIETLISVLTNKIETIKNILPIKKDLFYIRFHTNLENLLNKRQSIIHNLDAGLNRLIENLQGRKDDLLNAKTFTDINDYSNEIMECWNTFETFRNEANNYSKILDKEQQDAKRLLRLKEVSNFVKDIQYVETQRKIQLLKSKWETEVQTKVGIEEKIRCQLDLIEEKERLMKDEEKGALKVNEYLSNFFGHEFLSLQAVESEDKKIRFEIKRNEKIAHHLSEGETSLIAFCYFMAKLEDIETSGSKPIIWIDDPISSLDSNHVFFIYSLINSEIMNEQKFEQIFISTHNLDFLKYLKRLPGANINKKSECFLISRTGDSSEITVMPDYLKRYVTEFNFLFHQLYKCSIANEDDSNVHSLFYNFGNNTRKFLEVFLFYKYPNSDSQIDKITRFFAGNRQASTMTDRINNELSHLDGLFERGMTPIDIPEMKKTASFILDRIKDNDIDQYNSLLSSIGIEV